MPNWFDNVGTPAQRAFLRGAPPLIPGRRGRPTLYDDPEIKLAQLQAILARYDHAVAHLGYTPHDGGGVNGLQIVRVDPLTMAAFVTSSAPASVGDVRFPVADLNRIHAPGGDANWSDLADHALQRALAAPDDREAEAFGRIARRNFILSLWLGASASQKGDTR